jgi:hypothetical protein
VVTIGSRDDLQLVDVGAWAALVFGADGAPGMPNLCRPLSLHPEAFGVSRGAVATVILRITIVAPDQDLTRLHARTHGRLSAPESSVPLSPEAEAVVNGSVATLVETLRGLGGEASTAVVELEVRCTVRSL